MASEASEVGPTVLFDGVCNLCNGAVQFILDHERDDTLRFAALQSPQGQALLKRHEGPTNLDTIVVVDGDRLLLRSDAALRIARHLNMPYRALGIFRVVPRFLRDAAYGFIARHRYRWFGKSEACRVPTAALRARFLS